MNSEPRDIWQFGNFRLDTDKKILWHQDKTVAMPLKELEVLCVLVTNRGQLVSKDELLDQVWEDSFVEESNLSRHIYLLRRTLREFGADNLIENVPRRGYRFTGEAREVEAREIVLETRTRTRTLIEFQDEGASIPRRRLVFACAALLLVVVSAGAYLSFQHVQSQSAMIGSIAVLPFRTAGPGGDDPHSGAGLADILTTRLSNLKNIKIRPSSAAAALDIQDPVAAGQKLGVDAVIEGTIYHFNERVRVTARLVNVATGSVIWSGDFEKLKKEELLLQHDLATQIVPLIALNLSGEERDAIAKKYTESADAYELYLKGRYEWNKRNTPGMIEATRLFRNAIETDPDFALAYIGLADTLLTNQPAAVEAHMLINKALELDPEMAEAHASRGFYLMFFEWQWKEAEASFRRSIELNPNYATAHHWYATLLAIKGETEPAKAEMRRALELNPISYNFLADLGQLYYFSGEYREAEQYCLRALEIYPDFSFGHEYLHYVYLKTGEYEKAVAEITRADEINASFEHNTGKEFSAFDKSGDIFRRGGINEYLDLRYPGIPLESESFYIYARKHAFVGEKEQALDLLEKSMAARKFLSAFVKVDPVFEQLRSEPRYQEILRKMGLA
jgi:DNA-binding winged helix-turn-helix (wHTH) protein/tetratricopeptide (TPR) repeat protein